MALCGIMWDVSYPGYRVCLSHPKMMARIIQNWMIVVCAIQKWGWLESSNVDWLDMHADGSENTTESGEFDKLCEPLLDNLSQPTQCCLLMFYNYCRDNQLQSSKLGWLLYIMKKLSKYRWLQMVKNHSFLESEHTSLVTRLAVTTYWG